MTKYLVLDTNVFVQDFQMEGNAFNVFLQNYSVVTEKIIIPKVVYQETINQFSKRLNEEIESLNKTYKNLSRLTKSFQTPTLGTIAEFTKLYEQHFNLMLSKANFEVVDYPKISHENVAQKAIKRGKPFKSSGEGYCDALIWETIRGILHGDKSSEIIFITQNKKDFFDGDALSRDLVTELTEAGISEARISVWLTLKDVVDSLLLPHLKELNELKEQLNNNSVPGMDLFDWMGDKLFELIDPDDAGFVVSGVNRNECSIHLSEIYEVSSIVAEEARVINGGGKYILMAVRLGLSVELCADAYQYYDSSLIASIFDSQGSGLPTPYDCVNESGTVDVTLSMVVHDNDFANCNMEILRLDGVGGLINFHTIDESK